VCVYDVCVYVFDFWISSACLTLIRCAHVIDVVCVCVRFFFFFLCMSTVLCACHGCKIYVCLNMIYICIYICTYIYIYMFV